MDTDWSKNRQWIFLVLGRLALAATFLYAGFVKIKPLPGAPWSVNSVKLSLAFFALKVDSYQILAPSATITVAKILPPLELLLGLWLLSGVWLRFSALCTSLLLGGFIFISGWAHKFVLVAFALYGLLFALAVTVTRVAFKDFSPIRRTKSV